MEPYQRNHIRKNLPELQLITDCHVSFISYLRCKDLLGDYDVERLRIIENRYEKAATFYEIIVNQANSYWIVRDALKEAVQIRAVDIFNELETSPSNLTELESSIRKGIRYEVRLPVQFFTGREAEIALLHEHMSSQEKTASATIITQAVSVTGLGGIGKSELCRKYIELHSEFYDGNVIWIQAEREADMTRDFKIVAKDHLKIFLKNEDGSEKSIKTIVDEVYNYFDGERVLFVFDNAVSSDDEHLDIFLPTRVTNNPAIIITSRDRDWKDMSSKILDIGELNKVAAVEFVKKGLQILDNCQDNIIKKLVKKLQYFPLAIQQAISFIKERGKLRKFEIAEYLLLFNTNTTQLLNLKGKGTRFSTNHYSLTTYKTWKITTDLIASEEEYGETAIHCLNMMYYFQPDRISIELFLTNDAISKFEIESALQLLIKYSMINSRPAEKLLSIHRLVQVVTRINLKHDGKEEQVLHQCLSIFVSKVYADDVGHAKSLVEFSSLYPSLLKEFSLVPCIVGEILMYIGRKDCAQFCEKVHKTLSFVLPEGAVELIHLKFIIARELFKEKRYDKCLEALYQVLEKYKMIQASKNWVWCANFWIVKTLRELERFDDALEKAKTIFSEEVANLGEPVVDAAFAFDLYLTQRNYKGAWDWCQAILYYLHSDDDKVQAEIVEESGYIQDIWRRVLKLMELHENGYYFGIVLADHLIEVGKEKDSLQLSTIVYEAVSKRHGEEHPDAVRRLLKNGFIHINLGEYEQAVALYRKPGVAKMIEIKDLEIGLKTNQLVGSVFAKALSQTGAHQEALQLLAKGLTSFTEKKGAENDYVAVVYFEVAQVYANMRNPVKAMSYLRKADEVATKLENFDQDTLHEIRFMISQYQQLFVMFRISHD